jgi:MYXO-CTERM domain-containing protein
MLRAILATFVLMTGVLAPRLAVPGDTADTAVAGADTASGEDTAGGGDSASDTGADTAADTGVDTADTAGDPGFGAVELSGEPGGCGCASSSPAPGHGAPLAWVVLSGCAALVLRRRRA